MTKKFFETSLRAFQIREPFKTFVIELVSGGEIFVRHPEAVATHVGSAVFFAPDGAITIFEASSVNRLADARDRTTAARN